MVNLIIWIIVGLLALSFFGISLRGLIESPTNQDNVNFLSDILTVGFNIIGTWFSGIVESVKSVLPK